jgi:hypothetical protein
MHERLSRRSDRWHFGLIADPVRGELAMRDKGRLYMSLASSPAQEPIPDAFEANLSIRRAERPHYGDSALNS